MAVSRREQEVPELNLIPIMNLVTILIPFLIMAAQFVQLAVIDSTLPAIGPPQPAEETPDKPPLKLSLAITGKGITILCADAVLNPSGAPVVAEGQARPPTVPCGSGACRSVSDYNWNELNKKLIEIKDQYPDEGNVILVPADDINYEVIVKTMDASRDDKITGDGGRELFPYVVIAGGDMSKQ
jgi:biopolymer transport protein ExbD